MSIPNYAHIVAEMAGKYPTAWRAAHRGGPDTEDFIRLLAARLHLLDGRFGLNGKYGNPSDISDDAICFDGVAAGGDYDPTRGNAPVTVIDVIGGAGGPDPRAAWSYPLTPAAAAWVRPAPVDGGEGGDGPVDPPASSCRFTPCDHGEQLRRLQDCLDENLNELGQHREDMEQMRAAVFQVRSELENLIALLRQGMALDASTRILGPIRGTVRLPE